MQSDYRIVFASFKRLRKVARRKGFKSFWVVAELYKEFNDILLRKQVLHKLSVGLRTSEESIEKFINDNLKI